MIVRHIINYLKTVSAVTAIVDSNPIKVFPGDVPKQAGSNTEVKPPYVTIEERGGDPVRSMGGRTGVRDAYFSIQAVSTSKLQAGALYEAVADALDSASYQDWDGLEVQYSEVDEPTDGSVSPTDGAQDSLKIMTGTMLIRAVY